jgi:uncharacterized SAM-binding protein YcdF (DUF218 family)
MKKFVTGIVVLLIVLYLTAPWLLTQAGKFLIVSSDPIEPADAIVVLSTGVDYLPRLMQAAALHRQDLARLVVINGNRKTDVHRQLERQGYVAPYTWYDGSVSVLTYLGVDKKNIITINAEDAYDTVSEARVVGSSLEDRGIQKIIITSSKFHTRRAIAIWRYLFPDQFDLQVVPAKDDPFIVDGWWHHGRQIRQVMAEYGAWFYFWGKRMEDW